MALRTVEQYKTSLRDARAVYVVGQRVADVTTHPILQITAEHSANVYQLALDPQWQDLFAGPSPDTGGLVSRYFLLPRDPQELALRGRLIEEHTRLGNSTLNLTKAVSSDAFMALTVVSHAMDAALGTRYSERVAAYLRYVREGDLSLALAQTDAKGDRRLRPHEQPNPDAYVHIVERRADGIVVRGAKAHTTASPVVNELIVIPTRAMGANDADYAVAFALPVATPGLTLICRPTGSIEQSVFDYPISRRNIETESLTVFDDVFVPWERVFLAGEWQFAGQLANGFATFHRFTAVSYKPPLGDLLVGAAVMIAEANGTAEAPHVREKVARLVMYTELIRACGKAASSEAKVVPPGVAVPHLVYTNAGKYHFASQFHEACRLVHDIAGGMAITAPSEADLRNPETGPYVAKYLTGAAAHSGVERLRLFHLIRDLTAGEFGGYNYVTAVQGEGSLAAQLLATYREYDLERCRDLVRRALASD